MTRSIGIGIMVVMTTLFLSGCSMPWGGKKEPQKEKVNVEEKVPNLIEDEDLVVVDLELKDELEEVLIEPENVENSLDQILEIYNGNNHSMSGSFQYTGAYAWERRFSDLGKSLIQESIKPSSFYLDENEVQFESRQFKISVINAGIGTMNKDLKLLENLIFSNGLIKINHSGKELNLDMTNIGNWTMLFRGNQDVLIDPCVSYSYGGGEWKSGCGSLEVAFEGPFENFIAISFIEEYKNLSTKEFCIKHNEEGKSLSYEAKFNEGICISKIIGQSGYQFVRIKNGFYLMTDNMNLLNILKSI